MHLITTLGYALLGGFLPPLIWLYFLLKEDAKHPEPKTMIALAFVAGMFAMPLAIPLEQMACWHFALNPSLACGSGHTPSLGAFGVPALASWAFIEEVLKYLMAAAFILWRPVVDEAPDYVIYLVTVALGFSAAENVLYLLTPAATGNLALSLYTGDARFMGATLLHVFSSAAIGFALAFSDRSRSIVRIAAVSFGLILAVTLHTAFNTLIISKGATSELWAISLVWTAAVIFFAAFEVLKYFQYRKLIT